MRAVLSAVAIFAAVPACASDVIKDHGLEHPVVPPGTYVTYGLGQPMGAWTIVGPQGSEVALTSTTFVDGGFTFPAKQGAQFVDLTGRDDNGLAQGIAQSVTTIEGDTYQLSFWSGNTGSRAFGKTCTINVYNGPTLLITAVNKAGKGLRTVVWRKFKTTFVATAATTTLSFINANPSGYKMCGLDVINLVNTVAP